jgi:hypothetical protein
LEEVVPRGRVDNLGVRDCDSWEEEEAEVLLHAVALALHPLVGVERNDSLIVDLLMQDEYHMDQLILDVHLMIPALVARTVALQHGRGYCWLWVVVGWLARPHVVAEILPLEGEVVYLPTQYEEVERSMQDQASDHSNSALGENLAEDL